MIATVFAVLTAWAALPPARVGTAKTRLSLHEAKRACLAQDPELKGKALRTCMKAKRGK